MATPRAAAPALAGLGLAGIWIGLGTWQPTTTWHLAPLLVVWAPPWTAANRGRPHRGWVAVGVALAVATTGALHTLGLLRGPALIGPDATIEALIVAATGGLAGLLLGPSRTDPPGVAGRPVNPPAAEFIVSASVRWMWIASPISE